MHTVRNRVAARPRPVGKAKPHAKARKRREPAFMLQSGNPPAFPAGLIVPPPRGAVIATVPWPMIDAPQHKSVAEQPVPRRKAKVARKPRKPAARKPRTAPRTAKAPARIATNQPLPIKQDTAVPMLTADLLDRALAMQSAPVEIASATAPLPPTPAAVPPAAGATPLPGPIPRSQALAHQHDVTLLGAIGDWLRDMGRWLARWGNGRRKAEARTLVARANARHRALQSQVEALEALREVAKAD